MNMFTIKETLRRLGALAAGMAAAGLLGAAYAQASVVFFDPETTSYREALPTTRIVLSVVAATFPGVGGGLLGLKAAAERRPGALSKAVGVAALPFLPLLLLLFLFPYTTMLSVWLAPVAIGAGGLSAGVTVLALDAAQGRSWPVTGGRA